MARTLHGKWTSSTVGIDVHMTLTQDGAHVEGTATTNLNEDVIPFRGKVSEHGIRLHDHSEYIIFEGVFTDDDTVEGTVTVGTLGGPTRITRAG